MIQFQKNIELFYFIKIFIENLKYKINQDYKTYLKKIIKNIE